MLSGDNGILQRATDAKEITGVGQEKESISLAYNSVIIDKTSRGDNSSVTGAELDPAIKTYDAGASAENRDDQIIVTFANGHKYSISSSGVVNEYTSSDAKTAILSSFNVFNMGFQIADDYICDRVTSIQRTNQEPTSENKTSNHIISSGESDYPVYAWFENGNTLYFYTEANHIIVRNLERAFAQCSALTSITGWDDFDFSQATSVKDMFSSFDGCALTDISFLENVNIRGLESLEGMFSFCAAYDYSAIKNWDTSTVKSMKDLFSGRGGVVGGLANNSIDLRNWNTSNVEDMSGMFGDSNFISIDISSWDTSNVNNMSEMFSHSYYGHAIQTIYVSNKFVTSSLTETNNDMFYGCCDLKGGNGTECDGENNIDSSMAHIDTAGNPGYFTDIADKD